MTIYMGVIEVAWLQLHWRTTGIFSNLLPANVTPRDRLFELIPFLNVSNPVDTATAASVGKTWRVPWLLKNINEGSVNLLHAQCNLTVDERMVKSKA